MAEVNLTPELRFPDFENGIHTQDYLFKFCEVNPINGELPEKFIYIDLESVNAGRLEKENEINKDQAPSRAQRILAFGDILYQTVRPYQRNNYHFKLEGDYVASTGYAQIRNPDCPEYYYQLFHTDKFVNEVLRRCTGTSYPAINSTDLEKIPIIVPQPEEQQKIASFLTAVDERIQLLQQKKAKLEEYKKGVMQQLFSQQIRFKDENGNDFPDWEEKKLGEIVDYEQPTKYLVSNTEYDDKYQIPVLTAGKTFLLGYTYETEGVFEEKLPTIIFDDFTTAFQFVDFPFKAKSSAMKMLIPKSEDVNIRFIYEAMKTIKFPLAEHKRYWISEYQKEKIPYPSSIEQNKIIEFLSSLDNSIASIDKELEGTTAFKKGLLQKMFV